MGQSRAWHDAMPVALEFSRNIFYLVSKSCTFSTPGYNRPSTFDSQPLMFLVFGERIAMVDPESSFYALRAPSCRHREGAR